MIQWFVTVLRERPEVAFFVTITLGYALGRLRIGSFTLGAVTGVLLAGVLVGQLGVTLPSALKQVFFLLFLFSIGYRTGPQFFRGLKSDGIAQAALAAVFAFVSLGLSYALSRALGYQAGTAAGLMAGSLTQSATIGTANDAINQLSVAADVKTALINQIPVAYAVTYLIGVIVSVWFLSQLAPRIMGVDIAAECRAYEKEMGGGSSQDRLLAWRLFDVRTFQIMSSSSIAGRTVADVEGCVPGARLFVDRVRRAGHVEEATPNLVLNAGDVIALAGRHDVLIEHAAKFGTEVTDPDLAQAEVDPVDVIVTQKRFDGMQLARLAEEPFARGIFLRRINRAGTTIPATPATVIQRGDVLSIVGAPARTASAIAALGVADRVGDVTDMVFVGLGIVVGALIGIPAVRFGSLDVGLSVSVGVLLGGLLFGWLRSVRPTIARIPTPTLWLFESLGLTGFVAVIGLAAGPDFIRGLQQSGLTLVGAALAIIFFAQLLTLLVGHFIFRMHPAILLGACAGASTATPGLAAVQEVAKSTVPTLGYGVSYAVGNVLLALWGTVIVFLMA